SAAFQLLTRLHTVDVNLMFSTDQAKSVAARTAQRVKCLPKDSLSASAVSQGVERKAPYLLALM
ncbi:TPA: hypothetical protein ACID0D_002254, partial [Pseudomonas aeruginosa]